MAPFLRGLCRTSTARTIATWQWLDTISMGLWVFFERFFSEVLRLTGKTVLRSVLGFNSLLSGVCFPINLFPHGTWLQNAVFSGCPNWCSKFRNIINYTNDEASCEQCSNHCKVHSLRNTMCICFKRCILYHVIPFYTCCTTMYGTFVRLSLGSGCWENILRSYFMTGLGLSNWPRKTPRIPKYQWGENLRKYIWLVVWNMFYFPHIGHNHPNWRSYFSEGWPNHQPDMFEVENW